MKSSAYFILKTAGKHGPGFRGDFPALTFFLEVEMSGTQIGEVSINLRMSLASFRQDVKEGSSAAKAGFNGIAEAAKYSSKEATGSLALLGEELGIKIPRHLRTFITTLPGVGVALSSAFSGIAVLALIELITKAVEKIVAYRDSVKEAADAWDKTNQQGVEAIRALDLEIAGLQQHIDTLRGDHVAALADQLKAIDLQTMQHIQTEMTKIGTAADESFKKMKVGWLASTLGFGDDKSVAKISEDLDGIILRVQQLTNAGNTKGIGDYLNQQTKAVMDSMGQIQSFNGQSTAGGKAIYEALSKELDQLNLMYAAYQRIETVATDKTEIAVSEEKTAEMERRKKAAQELKSILESLSKLQTTGVRSSTQDFAKYEQDPHSVDPTGIFREAGKVQISPTASAYSGTSEARDQLNLLSDRNEQLQRGADLYTLTRTAQEQYANELQTLNTLLQSGAINQDTFNRAIAQAKAKYDEVSKGIATIGSAIGKDIQQAALYGQSWSRAFKDIAAEIIKVIIQMTLLKSLQQANAANGGGGGLGFLTAIVGGLAGKAVGGPVYQGQGYMVGERGPEFFTPSTSGSIIADPSKLVGSGGGGTVNNIELHVHNVADVDSFRKSQSQIASEMAAMLSAHAQRNG